MTKDPSALEFSFITLHYITGPVNGMGFLTTIMKLHEGFWVHPFFFLILPLFRQQENLDLGETRGSEQRSNERPNERPTDGPNLGSIWVHMTEYSPWLSSPARMHFSGIVLVKTWG